MEFYNYEVADKEYAISEYNNLKIGDIIWAKRYANEEEMEQIAEGHRVGPYVVVENSEKGLKCLYSTSSPQKIKFLYYTTSTLENNKPTNICLTKTAVITLDRFIKKAGSLSEDDIKGLYKKINMVKHNGVFIDVFAPHIPLEKGDIIFYLNNLYLIIDENKNKLTCIELNLNQESFDFALQIGDNTYHGNVSKTKEIYNSGSLTRYYFINHDALYKIVNLRNQHLEYLQQKNEIQRGSLVKFNDKLYYIYGEIGNQWQAFSVGVEYDEELCCLIIDQKKFYTNFLDLVTIEKNQNNFQVLTLASEREIQNIKDSKKRYQKEKQKSKKPKSNKFKPPLKKPNIQSGSVIKLENTTKGNMYVVVLRLQEEVIVARLDKLIEGEYVFNSFLIKQIEFVREFENFDLKAALLKLKKCSNKYISNVKLYNMICSLDNKPESSDNNSHDKPEEGYTKKLTPPSND